MEKVSSVVQQDLELMKLDRFNTIFIPSSFLVKGFIAFEDIDKPEFKYKCCRAVIEAISFVLGLTLEERIIVYELENRDLIWFKQKSCDSVFTSIFKKDEYYGGKCGVLIMVVDFIFAGHSDKYHNLIQTYKERVHKGTFKEYKEYISRFIDDKEFFDYLEEYW